MIDGLLALHSATGNQRWLTAAAKLQETQNELFWDEKSGGYFYTSNGPRDPARTSEKGQ